MKYETQKYNTKGMGTQVPAGSVRTTQPVRDTKILNNNFSKVVVTPKADRK